MKNGYTPRQFAHAAAIEGIIESARSHRDMTDLLPPAEVQDALRQMKKLAIKLADDASLDFVWPGDIEPERERA